MLPPTAALRDVRPPPLVHPSALQAAAIHCADFGGNKDLLNAAALAGALLQARLVYAKKQAGLSLLPDAHVPIIPPTHCGGAANGAAGISQQVNSAELSDQMRKAMAAAEATNQIQAKKMQAPPIDPMSAQAAQAAGRTMQQLQQPQLGSNGLTAPGVNIGSYMGSSGPSFPMMMVQPAAVGVGMLSQIGACAAPSPEQQVPQQMQPPSMQPPLVDFRPPPVAAPIPQVTLRLEQPPIAPKAKAMAPSLPHQAAKRDGPMDERWDDRSNDRRRRADDRGPPERPSGGNAAAASVAAEAEAGEAMRCHLHRKPQITCKICRRLHYSALDPGIGDRQEQVRDRTEAERRRRAGEGDDLHSTRRRSHEVFEIQNKTTFNFNAMLRDQILKNTYFKTLVNIDTFEGVVDELYQYADTAEVYGAGTTTVPSTLFCCLFRLFTLGISYDELQQLLDNREWPYVRCCGFLYIRFGCAPEKLWEHLGDYCLDDQIFEPSKSTPNFSVTIGEYVESLLMEERYYFTALSRIPVGVKKKIEEKVAPLQQYRKRTEQNKKVLDLFREPGTPVEVCSMGEWVSGEVVHLDDKHMNRVTVRVRLEDDTEETHHLGKVVLRTMPGRRGRSRSRSPRRNRSPDLTRSQGSSQEEMLAALRAQVRERAVCSSGKDYARKPIGFMSGLALKRDMGVQSIRLREEETYAPRQVEHRKQMTEEEEQERRKEERSRLENDRELSARMQQLYEKYGSVARPQPPKDPTVPEEGTDVLRLG